jgi:hypothetical protein
MIEVHGVGASLFAWEQAEIADGQNAPFTAEIWRDIADAIERLQVR